MNAEEESLPAAGDFLRLTNPLTGAIIKNEERTTHAVAPQFKLFPFVTLSSHENSRHLPEWRLLFLRSYTIKVGEGRVVEAVKSYMANVKFDILMSLLWL